MAPVDLAESACEACVRLARATYDVVLVDHRLPDGVGVQIVRLARQCQPSAYVVLMSAVEPRDLAREGFLAEAVRHGHVFVRKPFQAEALIATLEGLLGAPSAP